MSSSIVQQSRCGGGDSEASASKAKKRREKEAAEQALKLKEATKGHRGDDSDDESAASYDEPESSSSSSSSSSSDDEGASSDDDERKRKDAPVEEEEEVESLDDRAGRLQKEAQAKIDTLFDNKNFANKDFLVKANWTSDQAEAPAPLKVNAKVFRAQFGLANDEYAIVRGVTLKNATNSSSKSLGVRVVGLGQAVRTSAAAARSAALAEGASASGGGGFEALLRGPTSTKQQADDASASTNQVVLADGTLGWSHILNGKSQHAGTPIVLHTLSAADVDAKELVVHAANANKVHSEVETLNKGLALVPVDSTIGHTLLNHPDVDLRKQGLVSTLTVDGKEHVIGGSDLIHGFVDQYQKNVLEPLPLTEPAHLGIQLERVYPNAENHFGDSRGDPHADPRHDAAMNGQHAVSMVVNYDVLKPAVLRDAQAATAAAAAATKAAAKAAAERDAAAKGVAPAEPAPTPSVSTTSTPILPTTTTTTTTTAVQPIIATKKLATATKIRTRHQQRAGK